MAISRPLLLTSALTAISFLLIGCEPFRYYISRLAITSDMSSRKDDNGVIGKY